MLLYLLTTVRFSAAQTTVGLGALYKRSFSVPSLLINDHQS